MKPFTDPFPFRNPENRSSIGEVIAQITNGAPVEPVLDEGLLAKAGAAINKKLKTVKDDYSDWRTVRNQIKQTKKELASVKKEIATADSARDVWAWGKIKELNAQLERLKNEEKERLKAEKGATVREAVVQESHTRAALEKLSITRLRELKKKYEAAVLKGDRDAARELADIRGLLRAKGAGSVLEEGVEGDTHGGGATSVKRKTPPAGAKKFRGVPAPVVYTPTTPRGASPLKVSEACGAEQLDEVVIPVGALIHLPMWIKQAILVALVGGTALSYVLDLLHGLKLAMLDKETREQTLAVHEWAKRKAERDGIKAAKAALLKGHKPSKGKKPKSKGTKPVSEGTSPCEAAALERLKSANAEDLKEKPGAAGKAAHKRLHTTIGKIVKP